MNTSNGSCIQEGICQASATVADSVLVTEDHYYERIRFAGKPIFVGSLFALDHDTAHIRNTIIDADIDVLGPADTGSVARFVNGETASSILQGFVLMHGFGTVNVDDALNRHGGGILCSGSSPVIANCVLLDNTAARGGAMSFINGDPTVTNCTLAGNGAIEGGGIYCQDASPAVSRTIIAAGTEGCAVYCFGPDAQPTLTCCDLYGNLGGNWVNGISGQAHLNGNMERNPLFCALGADDARLDNLSPCLPNHPQNDCDLLIGAMGKGCNTYPDGDGDGVTDQYDNCPIVPNPNQADYDNDGMGDACEPVWICGDANADGAVNVGDAVYIISYLFRGGAAPGPPEAGDPNCDGKINVGDAVYLIGYIFRGGPAPCALCK